MPETSASSAGAVTGSMICQAPPIFFSVVRSPPADFTVISSIASDFTAAKTFGPAFAAPPSGFFDSTK